MLADAIRSALAQDYPHKQLIVIDDGSTDETRQLVSAFAGVEYYYQPNQGQAAARNAGLRHSRGEYIASLDSDDIWESNFLSAGLTQLHKHQADFVFLNWQVAQGPSDLDDLCQRPEGQRYLTRPDGDWWLLTPAQTRRIMVETCPAPSSAFVLRRAAVSRWNEQMRIADDWSMLLGLVLARPSVGAFTLRPHWFKRVHTQNLYDGRDFLAVTRELFFHDEPLLLLHYGQKLLPAERQLFRQRQARYHYDYAAVGRPGQLGVPAFLKHLAIAFWLAPLGSWRRLRTYLRTYLKSR